MTRDNLRNRLQVLTALAMVKALGIIAIAMVLHFRGQWMAQTDAMMSELAATCRELQTIAVQNRESINDLKKREVLNQ